MAQWRRILARLNPGLQARLGLAFAAVAVLAVAANLLAQGTVRVVERVLSPPTPPPTVQTAAPATAVTRPTPRRASLEPPVDADRLWTALEDYDRAVQSRVASGEAAVARQLASSSESLKEQLRRFQQQTAAAPRGPRRLLEQDLQKLGEISDAAIARADRRRALVAEYLDASEALAAQARQRMDGAWRIFGRVIARQQMIELRDRSDELRRRAVVLANTRELGAAELEELASREQALRRIVPEEPRRARRAGGAGAPVEPGPDPGALLVALSSARESLMALDEQARAAAAEHVVLLARAEQRMRAVAAAVPAPRPDPEPLRLAGTAVAQPAQVAVVPPAGIASPAEASSPPSAAPVDETRTVVEGGEPSSRRRGTLVWISVTVVLLTFAVSLLTARSLGRQVKHLLEGIRRVSRGEAARVSPGGIPDLDVLAAEFNALSAQLAAAREDNARYQAELEMRVAERTAQLHFQAAHDPLTHLPNRRELHRLLDQALEGARSSRELVGVFLIDLDNFKIVNDSMGHGFGDRVLVAMSQRLQAITPSGGFAARLGGDEFTVISGPTADLDSIQATGWALVRAFQQPLAVDGRELLLSVSVGAAVFPQHERDAEALLRAADSALFRAKALGRAQLALFEPQMLDAAAARFSTEQALRRAVERGEFELHYQPEIELGSFEVTLVEALLRWRLPDGRLLPPGEFLAVAEESGLITEISAWVLREAIAAAARWRAQGWSEVRVAVNVSPRQLVDQGFATMLWTLLEEHGLPPEAIEIELTEDVLQTGPHVLRTLQNLRALGVTAALDDFGTGYSSLASLEQLPLSRVKLDRSLIAGIDTNPRSAAIARAIIQLCEGLGLQVTAEGVERAAQFQRLLAHQPLLVQGYLLARPMAEHEILAARSGMPQHLASLLLTLPALEAGQQARPALPSPEAVEVDARPRTGYL